MLVPWRLKRPVSVLFVMVIPADTQGGATLIPVNDHEIATMSLDLNNLCPRSTLKTQRGICPYINKYIDGYLWILDV